MYQTIGYAAIQYYEEVSGPLSTPLTNKHMTLNYIERGQTVPGTIPFNLEFTILSHRKAQIKIFKHW